MNTDKSKLYKWAEITEKIIGCAFNVHNTLGCGFLEQVYSKALEVEFNNAKTHYQVNKVIKIHYKGVEVGIYKPDFIIENKVVVELKVVEFLTKAHNAQVINYLKATSYEVALLLNFNAPKLEYKRIVS